MTHETPPQPEPIPMQPRMDLRERVLREHIDDHAEMVGDQLVARQPSCLACGQPFPCDAVRLAEAAARLPVSGESEGLRKAVEASMNDIGLGTPERVDRARARLTAWAESFLNGLSFNEPTLQESGWAKRRAPLMADSIMAALIRSSEARTEPEAEDGR